jgi:hypothetical protein
MSHEPDGEYNRIAHWMDHYKKLHVLWEQKQKTGAEVRTGLRFRVFAYFGLPKKLQTDNGLEFRNKTVRAEIDNWIGDCKLRFGRPRHPQTQGLVEQGNSSVTSQLIRMKLQSPHPSTFSWVEALPKVMFNLNTDRHSHLDIFAYAGVFGQSHNAGASKTSVDLNGVVDEVVAEKDVEGEDDEEDDSEEEEL